MGGGSVKGAEGGSDGPNIIDGGACEDGGRVAAGPMGTCEKSKVVGPRSGWAVRGPRADWKES